MSPFESLSEAWRDAVTWGGGHTTEQGGTGPFTCLVLTMTPVPPPSTELPRGPPLHTFHGVHDPHCQRPQFTWQVGKQCPTPLQASTPTSTLANPMQPTGQPHPPFGNGEKWRLRRGAIWQSPSSTPDQTSEEELGDLGDGGQVVSPSSLHLTPSLSSLVSVFPTELSVFKAQD